jgi:filamentous hemagglutinin
MNFKKWIYSVALLLFFTVPSLAEKNVFWGEGELIVEDAGSRVARTIEELAPGGKIPKNTEFNKWFDDLNQEELSNVWNNDKLRTQIELEIRKPGGLHEWCMVCEVEQFKKWGVKMEDIKNFRTKTTELVGTNPYDGTPFAHSIVNSEGRVVSGPSSKTFHNELQSLIGSINNITEFNNGLVQLVAKWKINPNLLPPFIK